ncbi:MAG: CDP-diacylglycerol--glycerol-3-phosphate 3-phosphatidyltransferase [Nakamurella sp.]
MTPPGRPALMNLPNLLTMLRMLLVPIFVAVLFIDGGNETSARWWAGAVFAVAAITDRYDGQIARSRGQVTDFGKIADPIADKALIGAALVGLSVLHEIFWWVTVVILVREVGITLLRFMILRYGVIAASPGGKLKTLIQVVAIGLYIIPLNVLSIPTGLLTWGRGGLMGVAIVLTLATGIDYLARASALVARGRRTADTQ